MVGGYMLEGYNQMLRTNLDGMQSGNSLWFITWIIVDTYIKN